MKVNKQHVQVPNNMINENGFEPKDLLIYAILKKYMNNETKECFPSLQTLSEVSGCSINSIRNSISLLEKNNYISIRKEGKRNIYKFINSYKNFEPFSYDFLNGNKLETNEKAYIIAYQQYFMKDQYGIGKTTLTNETMSKKLNISTRTIERLDKGLVEKGYLNIVKTKSKDPTTGIYLKEKFFQLDELDQAIIWTLQEQGEEIIEIKEDIIGLKEKAENDRRDFKIILNENNYLKKKIKELEQERSKESNNDNIIL